MGMKMMSRIVVLLTMLSLSSLSCAADVSLDRFLSDGFAGKVPASQMLWMTPELKTRVAKVLDHPYAGMRVKYWRDGNRTAWVIDEIGKERPITIGVVVSAGHIELVKVLAFRESRGGEVRYPFFTKQFVAAGLKDGDRLDRSIDGITGATLSVWAVTKVSRLALIFHSEVMRNG